MSGTDKVLHPSAGFTWSTIRIAAAKFGTQNWLIKSCATTKNMILLARRAMKGQPLKRYFFSAILLIALAACSGEMTGQVRGTGERIKFTYEQGIDSDTYSTVIGGESFSGKAVMDGSSAIIATGFGNAFDAGLFGSTTTNRFVAVLLGNKGSSLNCQMRYADPSGYTTSGGVGVCQHSDGRTIDVVW
jgi:hypothetical protein